MSRITYLVTVAGPDRVGVGAELFAALRTVRASPTAAYPLGASNFSSEFLLSQNLISGAQSAAEET